MIKLRDENEIRENIGRVVEKMESLLDQGKQEESFIMAIEHGSEQALLEIEPKFKEAVELLQDIYETVDLADPRDIMDKINNFMKGLEDEDTD